MLLEATRVANPTRLLCKSRPAISHRRVENRLWNINPILSDKSTVGELLKSLFGYNGNPALTETAAYVAYLAVIGWFLRRRQMSGQVATASA